INADRPMGAAVDGAVQGDAHRSARALAAEALGEDAVGKIAAGGNGALLRHGDGAAGAPVAVGDAACTNHGAGRGVDPGAQHAAAATDALGEDAFGAGAGGSDVSFVSHADVATVAAAATGQLDVCAYEIDAFVDALAEIAGGSAAAAHALRIDTEGAVAG